jgi:hypothetical protein
LAQTEGGGWCNRLQASTLTSDERRAIIYHHLIFDDTRFVLPAETDVDALKQQVLDAAVAGGRYVHVRTLEDIEADLLVTPATPVRFEAIPEVEADPLLAELSSPIADWEL